MSTTMIPSAHTAISEEAAERRRARDRALDTLGRDWGADSPADRLKMFGLADPAIVEIARTYGGAALLLDPNGSRASAPTTRSICEQLLARSGGDLEGLVFDADSFPV